ncbi:MAG: ATP-binding cassette domain-containing protein [candidate division Zixibacteria bacterium]|nr:ATP-binding cassette domain-containing protein [candidate division Zixibacteria bacterium]
MSLYRRVIDYLLPYWKHILLSAFSMFFFALLSGALVWLMGPLMSTLFETGNYAMVSGEAVPADTASGTSGDLSEGQKIASGFDSLRERMKEFVNSLIIADSKLDTLANLCVAVVLIALFKSLFFYTQGYFMAYAEQRFIRNLRVDLFSRYQKLSLNYFHGTRTGQLISHVTNDVNIVRESLDQSFNRITRDPLLAVIYIGFMFVISYKLLLISILVLPLTFTVMFLIGRTLRRYSRVAQERMADVNTVLEENVSNMRIVKGFNTDSYEIGKFARQADDYFRTLLKISRVRLLSNPTNELLGTLATVVILWFGGQKVLAGSGLSASDFVLFAFAMFSLIAPVKSLSNLHIKIQEGMAAAERIFRVIDTPIEVKEADDAVEKDSFEDRIVFENVSFSYENTPDVLKDIDFTVKKGELIAIVGPSGAGKSTLCDLIPRFYDPSSGRIVMDGIDLRKIKLKSLRSLLGIVTQETMLFNDTIYNNVTYGLDDINRKKVEDACRIANAYDFITAFDKGFDTPIGNKGVMLSGGQRQRLAIARAVLRDPDILIFDEATSSLDTESEQLVQEAIDRLLKGRTTFVIAHRLSTILNADKILVVENGSLVESGTHRELLASQGLYRRLYKLQFKAEVSHGA